MKLDPKSAKVVSQWKHAAPLITCRYHPSGDTLFSSSEDFSLQRWDAATGQVTSWKAHESWVWGLACSPDGTQLVSAGGDHQLMLWDALADAPAAIARWEAHAGWVRAVEFSPQGQWIASAGDDRAVKVWTPAGKPVCRLEGHENHVYSLAFHPRENLLFSGDLLGKIHVWELPGGKRLHSLEAADLHTYNGGQGVHYGGIRGLAFSADGKQLVCCGLHKASNPLGAVNEPLAVVFDWQAEKLLQKYPAAGVRGIGWNAAWLADQYLLVAAGGSGGGHLLFWKLGEEKVAHTLKLPNTLRGMDLHPKTGLQLATAHHDRQLRITQLTG